MKPKTEQEIADMRAGGHMLASVLEHLKNRIAPGVTTAELGELARLELKALGGQPAFLGYKGFPSCICISVNEQVVHGIPGPRVINDGDVVGLDFGVKYNGLITDSAITVGVGRISADARKLIKATSEALMLGIEQVKPGARVGDIGAAIAARLKQDNLGIVEELAGHGVGHSLHEEPTVFNFGIPGRGSQLKTGMTIAIEPMAMLGDRHVVWEDDDWTVASADRSLSAHFEHTVLVTNNGYEILTIL